MSTNVNKGKPQRKTGMGCLLLSSVKLVLRVDPEVLESEGIMY